MTPCVQTGALESLAPEGGGYNKLKDQVSGGQDGTLPGSWLQSPHVSQEASRSSSCTSQSAGSQGKAGAATEWRLHTPLSQEKGDGHCEHLGSLALAAPVTT